MKKSLTAEQKQRVAFIYRSNSGVPRKKVRAIVANSAMEFYSMRQSQYMRKLAKSAINDLKLLKAASR